MTENPAVSVIMTVYNGEQFLDQAIQSVLRQTLNNFEFVIVDDGSQDNTPKILAEAQADPRIKVITQPHLGRARALNLAWIKTKGPYVANLDADDFSEPDRLEKQLSFFQQYPEIGLLGTAWNTINEKNKYVYANHPLLNDKELRKALIRHMQFCHSSMMIPRYVLEKVGGYNENLRVAIDADICVRIACHYQIANLPQILVTKRHRSSSFFSKIDSWLRYKTAVGSRWQAWRNFSGSLIELFYVINPIGILDQGIRKKLRAFYELFIKINGTK